MFARLIARSVPPSTYRVSQIIARTKFEQCCRFYVPKQGPTLLSSSLLKVTSPSEVCYSSQSQPTENVTVDFDYVKQATEKPSILIVDVREPEEVRDEGKIPSSINIPLGQVSTALGTMPEKEFEKTYHRLKPVEDTEIIFYCKVGRRSGMAQQNAINLGYRNVKNYLGSYNEWIAKTTEGQREQQK